MTSLRHSLITAIVIILASVVVLNACSPQPGAWMAYCARDNVRCEVKRGYVDVTTNY